MNKKEGGGEWGCKNQKLMEEYAGTFGSKILEVILSKCGTRWGDVGR